MDLNKLLAELREAVRQEQTVRDALGIQNEKGSQTGLICELFTELDRALTTGTVLPDDWEM